MNLPKLLTPKQAAEALGVKTSTLEVWRCTGRYDLPFVKSGRLVRYRESDIAAFIERRVRGGDDEAGHGWRR